MIRSALFRSAALATVVALGGCQTIGQQIGSGAATGALIQIETAVSEFTKNVCAFVPTAETIAEIVAKDNPAYQTAAAIGNAICAAVSTPTANKTIRKRLGVHTVAGVTVEGHFLQ